MNLDGNRKAIRKPPGAQYCSALGCRRWSRTYPEDGRGFLCGYHWSKVAGRRDRAVLRRIWRLMRRLGYPTGWRKGVGDLYMREVRCWSALVRRVSA